MEIRAHLTDDELTEAVRNPGRGLVAHLDVCDSCRTEVGRLRRALEGLLDATPSEDFWRRQRSAIQGRIELALEARSHRTPRLDWAAVAATVLLGTLLMNDGEKPVTPHQVQIDDQELMIAVDHAMQSNVPEALEPASLLAQEIGQSDAKHSNSQAHSREAVNEN